LPNSHPAADTTSSIRSRTGHKYHQLTNSEKYVYEITKLRTSSTVRWAVQEHVAVIKQYVHAKNR